MNDDIHQALADYRSLVAQIDTEMTLLHARHGDRITCHPGCDDCCRVERSALPIEAAILRDALRDLPDELRFRVRDVAQSDRCALLHEGLCLVYAARPLICRTHGAPLLIDTGEEIGISICDLNMAGFSDRDAFSDDDILDTVEVNNRLLRLNERFVSAARLPTDRVPLAALLSE